MILSSWSYFPWEIISVWIIFLYYWRKVIKTIVHFILYFQEKRQNTESSTIYLLLMFISLVKSKTKNHHDPSEVWSLFGHAAPPKGLAPDMASTHAHWLVTSDMGGKVTWIPSKPVRNWKRARDRITVLIFLNDSKILYPSPSSPSSPLLSFPSFLMTQRHFLFPGRRNFLEAPPIIALRLIHLSASGKCVKISNKNTLTR